MKKVYLITVMVFSLMLPVSLNANSKADNYEIVYWESIIETKDPKLFDLYLQKYPQGEFADLAKKLIEKYRSEKPAKKHSLFNEKRNLTPKKVAIFPFQFHEDAHYMQGVLTSNLSRSINTYDNLNLYASYYDLGPAGYSIPSLKGEEVRSKGVDLNTASLWLDSEPDAATIRDIAHKIGADTVITGSVKVKNPWSDLYVLGHIRIYAIDVETGRIIQSKNQTRIGDARDLLPHVINRAIGKYIADCCTPPSKTNISAIIED